MQSTLGLHLSICLEEQEQHKLLTKSLVIDQWSNHQGISQKYIFNMNMNNKHYKRARPI